MRICLQVFVITLIIGCGREAADLGDLRHERIIFSNDEKFEGIEIAQDYLESITRPLLSRELGRDELDFFDIWTAFGQKCDLWSYITRYSNQQIEDARIFVVSLSVKRKGQPEDDSGNLGERMLGSDGKLIVPVIKKNGKLKFDHRARLPGHPKYHNVLRHQQAIEFFISDIDYCFNSYKSKAK